VSPPLVLRGVDRAVFAVTLVARLRAGGVVVSASGPTGFVAALELLGTSSYDELYWAARLTLVNRVEDIARFEAVFHAVFSDAVLVLDPFAQRRGPGDAGATAWVPAGRTAAGAAIDGGGLPWVTRPAVVGAAEPTDASVTLPDALPSQLAGRSDEPFVAFDAGDLRLLGTWLERATAHWPQRRSMRRAASSHGTRIDLRRTISASRSTSWEPVTLARTRRRRRPRPVVLACDVSRSMQPYATIYLHLMRAAALRQSGIRPEVFAFATSLTRLTPALSHRSAEVALARANARVGDRFGGTHLGRSVSALLRQPRGSALRGAVVIIASDGWDADPPEVLERALARVRRRAERIVWLNPRAAAPGFAPLAGSMAAALPYCDVFLPAHSLSGLRELFAALA
jgi:uncharacterized protein with von Willebrand factor type A (vWA) domain